MICYDTLATCNLETGTWGHNPAKSGDLAVVHEVSILALKMAVTV